MKKFYCCEDHLNLKEDMENYNEWKTMKVRPRLKSTAVLKRSGENVNTLELENVSSETSIQNETSDTPTSSSELMKYMLQPIENIPLRVKDKTYSFTSSTPAGPLKIDVAIQCEVPKMVDKSTMVNKYISKIKPSTTLPMEIESTTTAASSSASHCGSTFEIQTDSDDDPEVTVVEKTIRLNLMKLISRNPKMYLGLPKNYLWLIKEIAQQMSKNELDIIIALLKIRLNDTVMRLADEFELSRQTIALSFYNGVMALANYFQNFVFMPEPHKIKENLPLVFKIRYSDVQCILDAFEIEIEKPNNPEAQTQTWSQYKHCNTIKYLVGCTPNGFISYISQGFGGRISDKALVEKSDLLTTLPINSVVMADRGFKEVEALLMTKNIKLLRPPSVYSTHKPTKQEVLQTKVIASLRVHIERVIRRIREFKLLKPHSTVSHKHVGYLDKLVLIACGLINLQTEIIKQ